MSMIFERALTAVREGGFRLLISKSYRVALNRAAIYPAARALRRRLEEARTLRQGLDIVYDFKYGKISVAPSQIHSELHSLIRLLSELRPRIVLEIGTGRGGTLLIFARVASEDATLITVDLPVGSPRSRLIEAGKRGSQKIHVLRANSHDQSTLERVKAIVGDGKVDFLFIDGDHSYEGVRQDYNLYSPLVHENGWIAFHDIVPGPAEFVGGVPTFWNEVKCGRTARELVHDWSQGGLGIGLIRRGSGEF
jgi:predicted O-methyltransferase YrrM